MKYYTRIVVKGYDIGSRSQMFRRKHKYLWYVCVPFILAYAIPLVVIAEILQVLGTYGEDLQDYIGYD